MADETIVVRFVTESDAAVKQAVAYRQEIEKAKEQIKVFATQAGSSYRDAARALKDLYSIQRSGQASSVATGLSGKAAKDSMAAARADITSYKQSVTQALEELQAAERKQGQAAEQKSAKVASSNKQAAASTQQLVAAQNDAAAAALRSGQAQTTASNQTLKAAQASRVQAQAQATQTKAANDAAIASAKVGKINAQAAKEQAAAQMLAAKAARENAAAQKLLSQTQVSNASQVKANLALQKEQARVQQEQAKAAKAAAQAQVEAAKASFAHQNEYNKAQILQAQAMAAAAKAAVEPQIQQQKVQQAVAQTANANAQAQINQSKAVQQAATAAVSGQMAQAKLTSAQNNAASSALKQSRSQQILANQLARSGGALQALGKVGAFVFGGVLGLSAIAIVQKLWQAFGRAVDAGVEFSNSMYRLGASVRALQRSGIDITIAETVKQVEDLRKQFAFMSRKEAVDGVASIQLLTRSFDFSKEQMKQVTEAATVLSVITGKDFGETARELALFLSSGYAESLQRAGLAVNRLTVAEEAQSMGIKKGYNALTEQERAAAGLSLVLRELAPLYSEVQNYQNSLAGQIDVVNASIENQQKSIEMMMAPLKLLGVEIKRLIVEVLVRAVNSFAQLGKLFEVLIAAPFLAVLDTLKEQYTAFWNGDWWVTGPANFFKKVIEKTQAYQKQFADAGTFNIPVEPEIDKDLYKQAGEDIADNVRQGLLNKKDAIRQEFVDAMESGIKDVIDLVKDMNKEIQTAQRELAQDMGSIDSSQLGNIISSWNDFFSQSQNLTVDQVENQQQIWEKFFGEFGNITDEGLNKAWGIWRDYYAKLQDIANKETQDVADAQRQLAQDLQDLERETQQKLQDAARKYREEELKAERDYQEKLRRLREEYLFDLEDALRERDALQVIRLMRRYQLDKQQLEREHENEKTDRADAYKQELEDIRLQAQRKAEELRIEHQRRLEEIHLQAERERQEAAIQRDQAMEELKQDLENQRKERQLKYEQEIADLKQRFEDELAVILQKLGEQYNLSDEELKKLAGVFQSILGANGPIAGAYSEFATTMGNMTTTIGNAVAQAMAYLAQLQAAQAQAVQISAQIQAQAQAAGTNVGGMSQMQQANQMPPSYNPWSGVSGAGGFNPYSGAGGSVGTLDPYAGLYQHALGGTQYANTPTLAMFGEGGPEIATFTPVSRLNTTNRSPVSRSVNGGGVNGSVRIEVALGPDLEARIVDNTLGQSAQIIEEALSGRG